jgi:peptide-methionine (S)-S-oxide reductase
MTGFSNLRGVVSGVLLAFAFCVGCRSETRPKVPAPTSDVSLAAQPGRQTAVFAGGCFWGTQSVFERVKGVLDTNAESVKVVYDPSKITYGKLLQIFFSVVHDPTQLNRQGPDVGTSYRSVIFYANEEQHRISADYIAQLDAAKVFPKPIVTQVVPLKGFYDAESYHQDYALNNPDNPYILVCDKPKIEALKAEYPELFQKYKGR